MGFAVRSAVVLASLSPLVAFAAPPLAGGGLASRLPRAVDLGATSPSKVVTITAWLRMHQADALEQGLQAMHDPSSAGFHRWADARALARHAPTAAEAATVGDFLKSAGLMVTGVGPNNLFVTAQGTVAQVQAALAVELHDFRMGSRTFHAQTGRPSLPSNLQPLVAHVGGLTDIRPEPMHVRPVDPDGHPAAKVPLAGNPQGLAFSAGCFRPSQTVNFTSADADATYTGNRYGQEITNTGFGTLPPCGYQPSEIQKAYSLDTLYKAGLNGHGQTVAIVDAFGSITIQQDVATFSALMGLPPADLTVLGTPTETDFSGSRNSSWADETTLDVEWVHAIAPGAKIVLVVAADNSLDNLIAGNIEAASIPGVSVISNSWGSIELATDPELRQAVDGVFQVIGATGIGINFSSGDSGDEAVNLGVADVDWPSSSPWVTSIGGVSLSLRSSNEIAFQTAWGNNLTLIAGPESAGSPPLDPVANEGFIFGGGGGVSDVYPKPSFQRRLPGDRRRVPDISWLADPYTGVEIIVTGDAALDQFIEVIGGTSLSCPMFSGLWAIAAQRAGHKLGQAAAAIYDLPPPAITDVDAVGSRNNVSGIIHDSVGDSPEVASDLAAPLQNLPAFYSALYQSPFSTRWFTLTFGTDSTLQPQNGHDLATGLGTPNAPFFVHALAHGH
ncbi:MAG TPA: S53 family peptidase [Vicinamibacteria bacterium]|nr:S53 family peptidase [Vicinamibacteria bacterium]